MKSTTKSANLLFISSLILFLISFNAGQVKAQIPSSYQAGHFYKDLSNGRIYWFAFGKLRHIQSAATLYGLFTDATKPQNMFVSNKLGPTGPFAPDPFGEPLTPDNGLINDNNTGIVYFRRGNNIHRIMDPNTFDTYHFNWAAITNVNGISGYNLMCPLPSNFYSNLSCGW